MNSHSLSLTSHGRFFALLATAILFSGCASLLPDGEVQTKSPLSSYAEAQQLLESFKPFSTTRQTVNEQGFDPVKQNNIRILTPSDILHRFVAGSLIERKDLDPGVLACFDAREKCTGWDINITKLNSQRVGNTFLDLVNYRRRTETTGWRFNAIILMVNDMVVYRSWGGQPNVHEVEATHNPLGPFQGFDFSSVVR